MGKNKIAGVVALVTLINTVAVTALFVLWGLAERNKVGEKKKEVKKIEIVKEEKKPEVKKEKQLIAANGDWECKKVPTKKAVKKPVVKKKKALPKKKKVYKKPNRKKVYSPPKCKRKVICRRYRSGSCCIKPDMTSVPPPIGDYYNYDGLKKRYVWSPKKKYVWIRDKG